MANVVLASDCEISQKHERVVTLREWLDDHWSIVMSHPDDFGPRATTPLGFVNCMADSVLAAGVKPMGFGHSLEALVPNWLDHAVNDDAVVLLDRDSDRIVDLAERALAVRLKQLRGRFILVLDPLGRCRSTVEYRAETLIEPCTMGDLLMMVDVLRRSDG